jgi:hypothetical protein
VDEGTKHTSPDPADAQPADAHPADAQPADADGLPESSPSAGVAATMASPPHVASPPNSDQSEAETKTGRNPFLLDEMMRSE